MDSASDLERAIALQRYGLLQLQQEYFLQRRNNYTNDGQVTPTPLHHVHSISPTTHSHPRPSSLISCADLELLTQSLDTPSSQKCLPDDSQEQTWELEDDEELMHINNDIKTTLTTLLNNASVRNNVTFRTLIQSRLLHVEQELKEARKRKSMERRERRRSSGDLSTTSSATASSLEIDIREQLLSPR